MSISGNLYAQLDRDDYGKYTCTRYTNNYSLVIKRFFSLSFLLQVYSSSYELLE